MATKILLEDTLGEFTIDGQKAVVQEDAAAAGRSFLKIRGRLSLCDTLNGNNRIYPRKVWEQQFSQGSKLMELIKRNRSLGLLEHPKDGNVSLLSPISHILIDAQLNESGEVSGELLIVNTPEGHKLRALIEAGYNPLVSSRGYGSLEKDGQGRDIVQSDYVCEGWDVVFHPSFKQCELEAIDAVESTNRRPSNIKESSKPAKDEAAPTPKFEKAAQPPEQTLVEAAKVLQKPVTSETTMDVIRQRLNTIAASDPSKLAPEALGESRAQLRSLHNDVAKWLAEDASRSWEAEQLHKAIVVVENTWDKAITQPREQTSHLLTERQKVLNVLNATVNTAKTFKTRLSETLEKNGKLATVNGKLLESVRAWQAENAKLERSAKLLEAKYNLACEALDIMASRWKADTTSLGVRIVELENPQESKNVDIAKRLSEAAHPDDVADIREALRTPGKAKKLAESKESEKEVAKPAETPTSTTTSNATLTTPKVLSAPRNPGSLRESINIARRLSGLEAKPLSEATKAAVV